MDTPLRSRRFSALLAVAAILGALPATSEAQNADDRPGALVPVYDLGGAIVDFGTDAWEVVSFPARLDARGWAQVGGVLGAGAALFLVDDEINARLQDHPRGELRQGVRDVGDFFEPLGLMGKTNVYYAGAATVFYFAGQERLQLLFMELLYAHWISGGTRQLVSRAVGRVRPRDGGTATTFDDGRSFPSGHSSTVTQVANILSHHIDWTPATVVLFGLAGTVVFQRVDSGAHWASDALVGAAWGYGISEIIIRVEEDGRLPANSRVDVGPSMGGLALRVTVPVRW